MNIVMLGAPGAGKGTAAEELSKEFDIPHISTGDIFRENIKNNTELGKKAKEYMDAGKLVPDSLTCSLVASRLQESDCNKGFILDGFPRTIPQAEALDEQLDKMGKHLDYAIDIEVEDEAIIKRMSGRRTCKSCGKIYHTVTMPSKIDGVCDVCGGNLITRADDNEDTVRTRLSVYHEQTEPLIKYYTNQKLIKHFDGSRTPDEVLSDILCFLKK